MGEILLYVLSRTESIVWQKLDTLRLCAGISIACLVIVSLNPPALPLAGAGVAGTCNRVQSQREKTLLTFLFVDKEFSSGRQYLFDGYPEGAPLHFLETR